MSVLFSNVFNHLVLPPKLPGAQDASVGDSSAEVLSRLIHATSTLAQLTGKGSSYATGLEALRGSLTLTRSLHALGRLEKKSLITGFNRLLVDQPLLLYIGEQNAALIIRRELRNGTDTTIFEAFETSPRSGEVLASEGALIWDFPDCAAQVPTDKFMSPCFQLALAEFLEEASMESLRCFQPETTKANADIVESRDTASPQLVTHSLMPLLEAIGCSSSDVPRVRKRVRDDVNIDDAEFPWRRLPLWLVLRVFAQHQLRLSLGNEMGRACYKFLIVTVLVEFLHECPRHIAPELTFTLRAKICRRLAKLEEERDTIGSAIYGQIFTTASGFFQDTITEVTKVVELSWTKFKHDRARKIPLLPQRAGPDALALTLPNSGTKLQNILNLPRWSSSKTGLSQSLPSLKDTAMERVGKFTNKFFHLADLEHEIRSNHHPQFTSAKPTSQCEQLAQAIQEVFKNVGTDYDGNPEQMSAFILTLFTLWVRLDEAAVQLCPLLLEYRPVFPPELLDCLHLPLASDMQQLHDIQTYLHTRCSGAKHGSTILSSPDKSSFAVRYVSQSGEMKTILHRVREASQNSREAKTRELVQWCERFDNHSTAIAGNPCTCVYLPDGNRRSRDCGKCKHWGRRKKMQISAHEDFLPTGPVQEALVIFELGIPSFLATYRNITWKIVGLAYPTKPVASPPTILLKNYGSLDSWSYSKPMDGVTVASTTKSFLQTHYKVGKRNMKASKKDVLYPNGLRFQYFDTKSGTWLGEYNNPLTFQHICGVHIPPGLRTTVMPPSAHPPMEGTWPTSYEIVASETKCPPNMSIHEFTAYQRLLSGTNLRWLKMLVDLGASDVNFSSESTMLVFNHLANQAGPARDEPDQLRDVHAVFHDLSFCNRLADQIRKRFRNIESNWREVNCMEVLITLSLRLFSLSPSKKLALALLKDARNITLGWVRRLRDGVRKTSDSSAAETSARFAFWAALLCRRTFNYHAESQEVISREEMCIFVQASLALQENLLVDLEKLPGSLKSMLIRDTKMAFNIQPLLHQSIGDFPESIGDAINLSWFSGKSFSLWRFLPFPHVRWVSSIMTDGEQRSHTMRQVVHYNFIEGQLLVDGKPLGRLPRNIRESNEVRELFGNQHILTFPSAEPGMSYAMASRTEGNEVHFGLRNGRVVIRSKSIDGVREYIPPSVFCGPDSVDLPSSLISQCAHWFNLENGCLEVRSKIKWKTRVNDWIIDVVKRTGTRSGKSYLVDPNSALFGKVATIFRDFEDPRNITVFQPLSRRSQLSVELRHLDLSFFVNRKGLLECRELGEVISLDQDAGTLYGLQSKIVLSDVVDTNRRSLIVPCGDVTVQRLGMHVTAIAECSTQYARFGIDDVLGRLSCAAEPRLLYMKAQIHAATSFIIPDPLTGRTGSEEALHILQSAYCQP